MKIFLLAVLLLIAWAVVGDETDPEDLGAITPRRAIQLDKGTEREDFLYFDIEFLPRTPPTNLIKFSTTNALLQLPDLVQLPSGKILMGVKSVFADGTTSPIELYTFRLWRGRPPRVRASTTAIGGDTNQIERAEGIQSSLEILIRSRLEPPLAPLPGGVLETNRPQTVRGLRFQSKPPPLPNATNFSYAEGLDRVADARLRRNQ